MVSCKQTDSSLDEEIANMQCSSTDIQNFMGDVDVMEEIALADAGTDIPESKTKGKRRVQRACDACRRKKVKCEDTRPCSRCIEDDDHCLSSADLKKSQEPTCSDKKPRCPVCEESASGSPRPCWRCVITGNAPVDEFSLSAGPDVPQDQLYHGQA